MLHGTAQDKEKAPLPMKEGAFEVPCDGVTLNFGWRLLKEALKPA
jgi:hypothetical protein